VGRKRKVSALDSPRTTHQPIINSFGLVGLTRFELVTPRLSSVCSNQLSYRPSPVSPVTPLTLSKNRSTGTRRSLKSTAAFLRIGPILSKLDRRACQQTRRSPCQIDLLKDPLRDSRKEVIQPQVLLQLPCYDFTPITDHTLGVCLPCGLARRLLVQPAFVM
jgi:hypothetical protein